jgi:hypothetical protein
MIPLLGFSPDSPTTTPGILLDCTNFIPYESGMEAAPSSVDYSAALAAACLGSEVLTKLDGSRRVFAGTGAKLYELSGTSWSDVSRGAGYTLTGDNEWSFAQFGDTSLAVCLDAVLQSSTAGAFADLTAPKAKIAVSVFSSGGGFVFLFNTNEATYSSSPDRWWCSALNDPTTWTPSVATQCTTGRLVGGDGGITAASALGPDRVVAFKANSLYLGNYVGPETVWAWTELKDFGCAGINAVADVGTALFVVGSDDIYIFDGARPVSIVTNKLRTWFNDNCSGTYRHKTIVKHYRKTDTVWIWYVSSGSGTGTRDSCLVYHLKTGQWGKADMTIESALLFTQPTITFDGDAGTFDAATDSFDTDIPGSKVLSVFTSSHVLANLNGTPNPSSFTLHDIGDDDQVTRLTTARLQYMTQPTSASMSAFGSMATGGLVTSGATQSANDVPANGVNAFPLRQTARWHRLKFNFTGSARVSAYRVPLTTAGRR